MYALNFSFFHFSMWCFWYNLQNLHAWLRAHPNAKATVLKERFGTLQKALVRFRMRTFHSSRKMEQNMRWRILLIHCLTIMINHTLKVNFISYISYHCISHSLSFWIVNNIQHMANGIWIHILKNLFIFRTCEV